SELETQLNLLSRSLEPPRPGKLPISRFRGTHRQNVRCLAWNDYGSKTGLRWTLKLGRYRWGTMAASWKNTIGFPHRFENTSRRRFEDVSSPWKRDLLHDWGKLEDERAYALFKSEPFDEVTTERIRSGVAKLKLRVLEQIDDPRDRRTN